MARLLFLQNWLKPTTLLDFGILLVLLEPDILHQMQMGPGHAHCPGLRPCNSNFSCISAPVESLSEVTIILVSVHPCCVRIWLSHHHHHHHRHHHHHHHHHHHRNHCKKTSDTFPGRCEFKVLLTQKPARVEPALPKGWHPVGTMSTANQVKTIYVQVLFTLKCNTKGPKKWYMTNASFVFFKVALLPSTFSQAYLLTLLGGSPGSVNCSIKKTVPLQNFPCLCLHKH